MELYRYAYYSRSNTDALPPRVRYRAPRTPRVLLYAVAAATYIEAELRELEQLVRLKQGLREPSLMLHNAGGR